MNLKRETYWDWRGEWGKLVYIQYLYIKFSKRKVNEFLKEPWIFPVCLDFGKQHFPWKKVLLICKASAKHNV